MNNRRTIFYLALIIISGAILRLIAVLHSQSFWFDEVVSLKIATKGIIESWHYLQWENNPPLHYWLLHFWIKLFGSGEVAIRLSSVLFSTVNIFLFFLLGRQISGRSTVGLFAAFLSAFSCYHLFTSMDARMYPLLLFFSLFALYFFWRYVTTNHYKFLWAYAFFSVLALYTHITALFLLISTNFYWLFEYFILRRKITALKSWFLANSLIALAWLPWFYSFASHNLSRFNRGAWYLNTAGSGFFLFELPRSFFFLGGENPFLEFGALLLLATIFLAAFLRLVDFIPTAGELKIKWTPAPGALFAFVIFAVPLAAGFCFQVWVSKYYLLSSAGVFLLLALGFDQLRLKGAFQKIIILALLLLFAPYNFWIIKNQGQHQWRAVSEYLQTNTGVNDTIFFPAFVYEIVLDHYTSNRPLPINHSLTANLDSDPLLLAIKYNWYPILDTEHLPDFNNFFQNFHRVFLVYPDTSAPVHRSELVLNWFYDHGWTKSAEQQFGGFERTTIYTFKNPAL